MYCSDSMIEGGLISNLKVVELTALLQSRGLQTTGNKKTLLKRLKKHLEGMIVKQCSTMEEMVT